MEFGGLLLCKALTHQSTTKTTTMPEYKTKKGAKIRFVRGKYKGRKGWLNDAMENSRSRHYVIVKPKKRSKDEEQATYVEPTSYLLFSDKTPENRFEATIQAIPDIDCLISDLAKCCVECHLTAGNSGTAVAARLAEAMIAWENHMNAKGSKGKYRKDPWKNPDTHMSSST
jgi:ribosomal protein L35